MARERGAGAFKKMADGRWQYRVSLGTGPDGSRQRHRFYGRTQAECREQAEEYRRNLRLGLPVSDKELLRDYLPRWVEGRKHELRIRGWEWYDDHVRVNLIPHIGNIEVSQLSRRHVVDLMAKLSRNLAPRTVNGAKATLGAAMQDALRDGLVQQNVARMVRQMKQPRTEIAPLTAAEIEKVRDYYRGSRDEAMYTIALAFGLRQGELLGLTWSDVRFDLGVLNVTSALQNRYNGEFSLVEVKTAQSRRALVMPDFVAATLKRHREMQDRTGEGWGYWTEHVGDLVFREPNGKPIHGETQTRRFQKDLDTLGIPRRRFHDLRHTCATFLLMSGVEMKVIQQILGHSTMHTTSEVYAHVLPQMQEAAFGYMGRILSTESVEAR